MGGREGERAGAETEQSENSLTLACRIDAASKRPGRRLGVPGAADRRDHGHPLNAAGHDLGRVARLDAADRHHGRRQQRGEGKGESSPRSQAPLCC